MQSAENKFARSIAQSTTTAYSIASVTVVYNAAGVLRRHLGSLKRQSCSLDEIVVVNNASSDNTASLLAAEFPEVTVLNLPENRGVGGGYAAGLAYTALNRKYDWIWLFDQDSVPAEDSLRLLLQGLRYFNGNSQTTAILAPVCIDAETQATCPGLSWRRGNLRSTAEDPDQPITLVDSVISSGSLIRREAVEAVGLPRADFFMDFVDYEHCLRLRRRGFAIAVVRDSHLEHRVGNPVKFNFLGRPKYWTDHAPWREYYKTRNEIFTIWQYYPTWRIKSFTLYRLARHAFVLMLFGKRKGTCLRMMYRGFVDGIAGRLGVRSLEL